MFILVLSLGGPSTVFVQGNIYNNCDRVALHYDLCLPFSSGCPRQWSVIVQQQNKWVLFS